MQKKPFVLRRYDKDPKLTWIVSTYSEMLKSKAVEIDGIVAPTIFANDENGFLRAQKLGWTDETERYYISVSKKEAKTSEISAATVEKKASNPTKATKRRGRPKKSN